MGQLLQMQRRNSKQKHQQNEPCPHQHKLWREIVFRSDAPGGFECKDIRGNKLCPTKSVYIIIHCREKQKQHQSDTDGQKRTCCQQQEKYEDNRNNQNAKESFFRSDKLQFSAQRNLVNINNNILERSLQMITINCR